MIETHAHIYDEQFAGDRTGMLNRAWEAGIQQIWMPNCNSETLPGMLELADAYPGKCLPMAGLHPCYVKDDFEQELESVARVLSERSFIAIGEIGMDLYWDTSFKSQQEEAFRFQCNLAVQHHLPIAIHSRNAFHETVALIEQFANPQLTGIFHCFSGTPEDARKAIDLGFKLGIGGVVTFKNSGLDKLVASLDLEHIVLETDCPYLAPVPYRGKRNEVAYLDLVAQKIADLKELPKSEVVAITTRNAKSLLPPC